MKLARLFVVIAISASLLSQSPKPSRWDLRLDGVGSVRIGMTLREVKAAIGGTTKDVESGAENCFYLASSKYPQFGFMIENGKLSRVDVTRRGAATDRGIQVGDEEEQVRKAYGPTLKTEPSAYTAEEGGHFLTYRKGTVGIRFETDGKVVTGFYAGRYESIQYIEGCD